jgi:hypothetical protein
VANYREYKAARWTTYVQFYIRMDNKYKVYERKIYSILELLGDIGGLVEAVHVLGLIMVAFVVAKQFEASLMKKVY